MDDFHFYQSSISAQYLYFGLVWLSGAVYKTSSGAYSPDEAEFVPCSLKGCSICSTLIVAYLAV